MKTHYRIISELDLASGTIRHFYSKTHDTFWPVYQPMPFIENMDEMKQLKQSHESVLNVATQFSNGGKRLKLKSILKI